MDGNIAIVVPMKVWTPGLHGFRAKYLQSSKVMIPPHIPVFEWTEKDRGRSVAAKWLAETLLEIGQDLAAFSYTLSRLVWEDASCTLSLGPSSTESFLALRRCIQKKLGFETNYREQYEPLLLLAANNGSNNQYELEEAFRMMNGDSFSLTCRATELEIYRKRSGDWLLREVVPMRESEEN